MAFLSFLSCTLLPAHPHVQALLGSSLGLRCDVGGLPFVDPKLWTVGLRRPGMAALSRLILPPHKRLSAEECVGRLPGAHLRQFEVAAARAGASLLCVVLTLRGGPAVMRTADAVLVSLG